MSSVSTTVRKQVPTLVERHHLNKINFVQSFSISEDFRYSILNRFNFIAEEKYFSRRYTNAVEHCLFEIEHSWICFKQEYSELFLGDYIFRHFVSKFDEKVAFTKSSKDFYRSQTTQMEIDYLLTKFLHYDGGEDDPIHDCGCADSMREATWRKALSHGRLSEHEKTLMKYEPYEAVIIPPDYYRRFYLFLIGQVGWSSNRDFNAALWMGL